MSALYLERLNIDGYARLTWNLIDKLIETHNMNDAHNEDIQHLIEVQTERIIQLESQLEMANSQIAMLSKIIEKVGNYSACIDFFIDDLKDIYNGKA